MPQATRMLKSHSSVQNLLVPKYKIHKHAHINKQKPTNECTEVKHYRTK